MGSSGAGEETGLGHGLRGEFGVDAGGAEEEEAVYVVDPARFDGVGLNDEVIADEVGRIGVVGQDSAYFGSGQEDVLGLLFAEELVDVIGVEEIELGPRAEKEIDVSLLRERAVDGRAYQATRWPAM